ncbi:MAG: outer membrane beta-barrel protein [Candidatus Aminicenantes bacterium]|nr:outer membrane beta-barrel protein [Candidatus Aminicenantes bacterium]
MRARVKSLGVLISALLVMCLLSWPEEAKKGPDQALVATPEIRGADLLFPPGFDDLFDKVYYETRGKNSNPAQTAAGMATAEPNKPSRLSLRLYGGLSHLAAGDLNEGLDGYFELFELYRAMIGGSTTGGYKPLHAGYNFGADLVFQLTPNIGVGIGAGYLRSSKSSLMTLSIEEEELTLTGTPMLSAMPIRLAVFLTLPLGGKFNLTADAGAAYYAALKFDATQRIEFAADDWQEMSLSANRSSLSDNLGFQGSLGFEYQVSSRMGFFIEAVGRYARFKNFDTATGTNRSSGGGTDTNEGKLYIQEITEALIGTFSWFTIEEVPPTPDPPDVTYREPKIDLSGFSLQAGIRIRF